MISRILAGTALALLLAAEPVHAYVGPGGIVSGIGAFLALLGAVALSVLGFVWFPMKRLLRRMRNRKSGDVSRREMEGAAPNE